MQTIILRKGKLSVIKRIIKVTTTVCFRNPQTFGEVCQKKLHLQPYNFPTTNSSGDDNPGDQCPHLVLRDEINTINKQCECTKIQRLRQFVILKHPCQQ